MLLTAPLADQACSIDQSHLSVATAANYSLRSCFFFRGECGTTDKTFHIPASTSLTGSRTLGNISSDCGWDTEHQTNAPPSVPFSSLRRCHAHTLVVVADSPATRQRKLIPGCCAHGGDGALWKWLLQSRALLEPQSMCVCLPRYLRLKCYRAALQQRYRAIYRGSVSFVTCWLFATNCE